MVELRQKRAQLLTRLHSEQRQTTVLAEQLARVKERLAATWASNQQLLLENSQLRQAVEDASDTAAGTSSSAGNTPPPQHLPLADLPPSCLGQPPTLGPMAAGGVQDGAPPMPLLARHHSAPWELMASPSMLCGAPSTMAPPAAVVRSGGPQGEHLESPLMARSGSCPLITSSCGTPAAPWHAPPPNWAGGGALQGMPPLQRHGSGASSATADALPTPPAWQQQQHCHAVPLQAQHTSRGVVLDAQCMHSNSPPADVGVPGPPAAAMPPVWPPPPSLAVVPPPGFGALHGRAMGPGSGSSSSSRPPMRLRPASSLPPAWEGAPGGGSFRPSIPPGPLGGFVGAPLLRPPPVLCPGSGAQPLPPCGGLHNSPSPPLPPTAGGPLHRSSSSPYLSQPVSPTWGNGTSALHRSNSSVGGLMGLPGPQAQDARMMQHPHWLPAPGHVKVGPVGVGVPPMPPLHSSSSSGSSRPVLGPAGAPWPLLPPHGSVKQEGGEPLWRAGPAGEEGGGVAGLFGPPLHQPQGPAPPLGSTMLFPYRPGAHSGSGGMLAVPTKQEVPSPVLSATVAGGKQVSGTDAAWSSEWSPGPGLAALDALTPMGAAGGGAAPAAAAVDGVGGGHVPDHMDLTVDQVEALLEDKPAWPCSSTTALLGSPAVATSGATPGLQQPAAALHSSSGALPGLSLAQLQVGSNSSSSSTAPAAALLGSPSLRTVATEQLQLGGPVSTTHLVQLPAAVAGCGPYHAAAYMDAECTPGVRMESKTGDDGLLGYTGHAAPGPAATCEPPASDSSNMTEVPVGVPLPMTALSDMFKSA